MGIFELILLILEGGEACMCFVQLIAAGVDLATALTGARAVKEVKKRRGLRSEGIEPEGPNTKLIAFWVLLPFAVIATGLALLTLITALRQ